MTDAEATPPAALGARGAALYAQLEADLDLAGAVGLVAVEAARCADRLDRLDAIIAAHPEWSDESRSAFAEARQQQNMLRQLMVSLGVKPTPRVRATSGLDDLASARARRLAEAAGPDSASVSL